MVDKFGVANRFGFVFAAYVAFAALGPAYAGQIRLRESGMYSPGAIGGTPTRFVVASSERSDSEASAKDAVVALGERLGVKASVEDLRVRRADTDAAGRRHVRLQQLFGGILVDGRELIVHFDANGSVYEINGNWLDTSSLNSK